jgi:hypothetical protein
MPFVANRQRPSVRRSHNRVSCGRLNAGRGPPHVRRTRLSAGRRPPRVSRGRLNAGRRPPRVSRGRLNAGRRPPRVRRSRPPLGHISPRPGRWPFDFNRSAMSFKPESLRLNRARLGFVHTSLALGRFPPNRHGEPIGLIERPVRFIRARFGLGRSHLTTSDFFLAINAWSLTALRARAEKSTSRRGQKRVLASFLNEGRRREPEAARGVRTGRGDRPQKGEKVRCQDRLVRTIRPPG